MSQPLFKVESVNTLKLTDASGKPIKERIFDTHTEEIIIGLCGPIGTEIHFVSDEISHIMSQKFGYVCEVISLSTFIKEFRQVTITPQQDRFKYMNTLISEGNTIRQEKGDSVLAELAINKIAFNREVIKNAQSNGIFKSNRVCYIIDSIKNSEELALFRLIYHELFYFVGVFSNLEVRQKNLELKGLKMTQIYELIDRDSGEDIHFGQKVADTFVQADYFLRIDQTNSPVVRNKLERFLSLIFNSDVATPTVNETAMYQAFAAAGNSACLSRQVGASVTNRVGDVISVGWNDVPKYGGSVYKYEADDPLGTKDSRCVNSQGGVCFNDQEKITIRTTIVNTLVEHGVVQEQFREQAVNILKSSRIKELIEFSRAVHAELHALIMGGQTAGMQIRGGKLFCTTYPCHNCARHIVLAGIEEVYYIEPYRKSLALRLHHDSITEDEKSMGKVRILMYDGVSPHRYLDFFKVLPNSRKLNGKRISVTSLEAKPRNMVSLQAIPILEKEIIKELQSKQLIKIDEKEQ